MSEKKKEVFGTKEWASNNFNILSGCQHDCIYCYAKTMAIRFNRHTVNDWQDPILREKKLEKNWRKKEGTIMYPTTHDIHPEEIEYHIQTLRKILVAGNDVLIVSKPHLECIERIIDEFQGYKDKILFRFTIGSNNDEVLRFWEPNAPCFKDRWDSLKLACIKGFKTSVSCEPMLDNDIDAVINKCLPFVTDAIWIGKMNDLRKRISINTGQNGAMDDTINQILNWQSDQNIHLLYNRYKNNIQIKWKESIKKVVGIEVPTEKGLDI